MPPIDETDNPIKGFTVHRGYNGLFLHCKGLGYACDFNQKIPNPIAIEELIVRAMKHRKECKANVNLTKASQNLPIRIIARGSRFAPVEELYHRWVGEGAPPLGTSISRWWDKKLVELGQLIRKD